jgi:uncharacterized membrane protein
LGHALGLVALLGAEEALRERFARGDIDEEEFALKLKALQASRRPA